jgi:NAD(P)-dependent dehydrogenase (short-subunit alcohol dehydrogenase family)
MTNTSVDHRATPLSPEAKAPDFELPSAPGQTVSLTVSAQDTQLGRSSMNARRLITTPFGFDSTAAEVVAGIDLTGKRAIVTGSSSGIGIETARALAAAGAEVTLAVRDAEAGAKTAADITATTGSKALHVAQLDLADPRSVVLFVAGWSGPLDLLINNAGVMALPDLRLTPEGWELQFATNHLGHFALAVGLHDSLAAAPAGARIVSLSSRGHLRSPVVFDDINFASRPYDPFLAYGQSKTANVLFAVGATRHWSEEGITANAVHPGAIETTNLSRYLDPEHLEQLRASGVYRYKTAEQGAATSILVATSPQLESIGGRYFEDCNEAPVVEPDSSQSTLSGVASYAVDPSNAERLWELSQGTLS